jgi:hypothetical protein
MIIAAAAVGLYGLLKGSGHESKQSVLSTTTTTANIVQQTAQNCIDVSYGGNVIDVNGNYNILSGVDQTVSLSVNSDCSTFASQNSTFNSDLSDAMSQILSDQEVALTQWIDTSKDTQYTNITENVTANFTQSTVQSCVNNLNGYNVLSVTGSGNVIKNITQDVSLNILSQCLIQNSQTGSSISDITNTVNQHSTYTSTNPFAFIADALESMSRSAMAIAAIIFIVIVSFVIIFMSKSGSGLGSSQLFTALSRPATIPTTRPVANTIKK